jgi:hypothetical protein
VTAISITSMKMLSNASKKLENTVSNDFNVSIPKFIVSKGYLLAEIYKK